MKFFDWLSSEQKEALAEWFITYQQYVGTGKSLVGTVTDPLRLILLGGALVVPQFFLDNAVAAVLLVFLSYIVIPYYLGWWWDEKRYFRKTAVWGNKRNDMKEQLDRIEALLLEWGKD